MDSLSTQTNVSVQYTTKDVVSKDLTVSMATDNHMTCVHNTSGIETSDATKQVILLVKRKSTHLSNSDDKFSNMNVLEKAFMKMQRGKLEILFTGIRLVN